LLTGRQLEAADGSRRWALPQLEWFCWLLNKKAKHLSQGTVVYKVVMGKVLLKTSAFPCHLSPHKCPIFFYRSSAALTMGTLEAAVLKGLNISSSENEVKLVNTPAIRVLVHSFSYHHLDLRLSNNV
jgi:hypothetical protein